MGKQRGLDPPGCNNSIPEKAIFSNQKGKFPVPDISPEPEMQPPFLVPIWMSRSIDSSPQHDPHIYIRQCDPTPRGGFAEIQCMIHCILGGGVDIEHSETVKKTLRMRSCLESPLVWWAICDPNLNSILMHLDVLLYVHTKLYSYVHTRSLLACDGGWTILNLSYSSSMLIWLFLTGVRWTPFVSLGFRLEDRCRK